MTTCSECGASLSDGRTCRDYFHELLLLEGEVAADPAESAGDRGEAAHFCAVSSYILQHPTGMNFTAEALAAVRQNLADYLAGRVTLERIRREVRRASNGPQRVMRRSDQEVIASPVQSWPMTVVDILAGGTRDYSQRVAEWAESVVRHWQPPK